MCVYVRDCFRYANITKANDILEPSFILYRRGRTFRFKASIVSRFRDTEKLVGGLKTDVDPILVPRTEDKRRESSSEGSKGVPDE